MPRDRRYPSDLTDAQWALIEPLLPAPRRGGRSEKHPRTLAWLTAHRRLARDYERHPEISEAMIRWAAINGMLRRLTRGQPLPGRPGERSIGPHRFLLNSKPLMSCAAAGTQASNG